MTPRAQREQRKRWRKNSTNYLERRRERQNIERIIVENSPPPSEPENMNAEDIIERVDPLESNMRPPTRQPTDPKVLVRRLRYRHMKTVKQLKSEISKLKNEITKIKRDNNRKDTQKEEKNITVEDSAEKRVNEIIVDIKGEKVDEIKKKLLFGETLSKSLKQEYQILSKKNKKPFVDKIIKNRDQFKKHKILNNVPFSYRKQLQKPENINEVSEKIKHFLEDDANTSLAPGKKEFVKRNGVKKQKRYLRDNLKHLHETFCKEETTIGYSTFCKYRPFWIVAPNTRETCGCKLHTNMDLLMDALKKAAITKEGSGADVLKYICCNIYDEKCLSRTCQRCLNKVIEYKEFRNDEKIAYLHWTTEKQRYKTRDGKEKITRVTIKKKLEGYPRDIIQKFEESILPKYLIHNKNIAVQYASIKELKQNLRQDEILIHIDFSENYCLKYNTEIQSFHFGGSRGQVSLHTGVLYSINTETKLITTKSFCTVSKCIQHDAASIRAHLNPVLEMAKEFVPALKAVHFLSDSPTSQYRNKYIFYMMTKLKKQLPSIEKVTWNYLEAGHGKGAPDGIGAVVKRTADEFVKYGGDIGSFDRFVETLRSNIGNVKIDIIEEDTILSSKFPQNIPTYKGTINVHQVVWCLSLPYTVAFRRLSCFKCQSSYVPCSHNKHLGVLSIGVDIETTSQTYEMETTNPEPESILDVNKTSAIDETNDFLDNSAFDLRSNECTKHLNIEPQPKDFLNEETPALKPNFNDASYLNIDSPTICNNISNIDDTALLNEIDDRTFLSDSKASSPQPARNDSPKVKILSNVPFDWQRYTFYNKKSRAFHSCGQEEFEKFISNTATVKPSESPLEIDNDNNCDMADERNIEIGDGIRTETDGYNNKGFEKENINNQQVQSVHSIGDWVIVQYQIKCKVYSYIGKITEYSNGVCKIIFMKKTKSDLFSWPNVEDEDTIDESRILCSLPMPKMNRRGQYYFDNLPKLSYR